MAVEYVYLQHHLGFHPEPLLALLPLCQPQVVAHVLHAPLLKLFPLYGLAEVGAEDILVEVKPKTKIKPRLVNIGKRLCH